MCVTSSTHSRPRRKTAPARRAEIVSAASDIALTEGLGSLTLRRVAATVDVFPGLIHHYFPSVDDLVANTFGHAAAAELKAISDQVGLLMDPLARLRALVSLLLSQDRDAVSLLWLDAWQGSRHRAALRAAVIGQMRAWQDYVAGLIADGVAAGAFKAQDISSSAVRILAAIDGLSIQAAVRASLDYATVREMVLSTIERELGLPSGHLAVDAAT